MGGRSSLEGSKQKGYSRSIKHVRDPCYTRDIDDSSSEVDGLMKPIARAIIHVPNQELLYRARDAKNLIA